MSKVFSYIEKIKKSVFLTIIWIYYSLILTFVSRADSKEVEIKISNAREEAE